MSIQPFVKWTGGKRHQMKKLNVLLIKSKL